MGLLVFPLTWSNCSLGGFIDAQGTMFFFLSFLAQAYQTLQDHMPHETYACMVEVDCAQ